MEVPCSPSISPGPYGQGPQFYYHNDPKFEPRREKTGFLHMLKTKLQISFAVTAKLISAFVFAIQILQSLYFLNLKFQASNHLMWLYSLVCVGPGRNPEDQFSHNEAHI